MAFEIERKFLVKDDSWKNNVSAASDITQGYLSRDPARTVRIRRKGDEAFITIKGMAETNGNATPVVPEFEYAIPADDAAVLMALCLPGAVVKTRHLVEHDGKTWEVDVFHGDNAGLVMAEIELSSADEAFSLPPWAGQDVTGNHRFSNAALAEKPYKTWDKPAPIQGPAR